jgi:hypothetical protein
MPIPLERELGTLIRLLNPYTRIMHYEDTTPSPLTPAMHAARAVHRDLIPAERDSLAKFQLEVDDHYGPNSDSDYLTWQFKGQPQAVKKAVRVQFRHPVTDAYGNVLYWITDHLLVGYAGSNGSG